MGTSQPGIEQTILDKLAKLYALEQNPAATEAEAHAAADAATRLLTKHNLDALDVQKRLGNQAAPLQFVRKDVTGIRTSWERMLIGQVAKYNQCKASYFINSRDAVIFGPSASVEQVWTLYQSLARIVTNLGERGWAAVTVARVPRERWKTAYRLGCVSGIATAMERAAQSEIDAHAGGSALVLVQEQALAAEMESQLGKSGKAAKITYNQQAYSQGFYDGLDVNVAQRGELS